MLLDDVATTLTVPAVLAEHASAGSALKNLAKYLKKNCSNFNNMAAKKLKGVGDKVTPLCPCYPHLPLDLTVVFVVFL